jgi:hypothetical protein
MPQWPPSLTDPSYAPMVLGAVSSGDYEHVFVPLKVGGVTFQVSRDALKIGGVRVNMSAVLQQHVADLLGARLLTPTLLDQMWAQRQVTLTPCVQTFTESTAGMIAHSACIDQKLAAAGGVPTDGIVQTVGKTWVLDNELLDHPGMACNMGWYLEKPMPNVPFDAAPTLAGAHMIQSPGYAHSAVYAGDYSQVGLFVLADDNFDTTVANGGVPLRVLRQPGAPELVTPPASPAVVPGAPTVAIIGFGAVIGAKIAGAPGALMGGALGWTVDTIRRRLISPS